MLNNAESTYTLNFDYPSEIALYSAVVNVVEKATTIIAIWHGKEAEGL